MAHRLLLSLLQQHSPNPLSSAVATDFWYQQQSPKPFASELPRRLSRSMMGRCRWGCGSRGDERLYHPRPPPPSREFLHRAYRGASPVRKRPPP